MTSMFTPRGEEHYVQAKVNLSRFVKAQAVATRLLVGFGWRPVPDAPSQFSALKRAYLASAVTSQPLPVSDEHSTETIYVSSDINYAFRFWHDITHIRIDQGFDWSGELAVGMAHLAVLTAAGWGEGTPEYELLRADTLGQVLCSEATGEFPVDQPCFARRAITTSLGQAVRAELDQARGRVDRQKEKEVKRGRDEESESAA